MQAQAGEALTSCRHAQPLPPLQAFSGFYYTFHFLNLTSRQPLGTVNASIWDFCQRSWWQVGDLSPAPTLPILWGFSGPRFDGGAHASQYLAGGSTVGREGPPERPPCLRLQGTSLWRSWWLFWTSPTLHGPCRDKGGHSCSPEAPLAQALAREHSGSRALTGSRAHWLQVKSSYPGQERWLPDYCASGLYILTLLRDGYGFQEETWPSIEFQQQVMPLPGTRLGVGSGAPAQNAEPLCSSGQRH